MTTKKETVEGAAVEERSVEEQLIALGEFLARTLIPEEDVAVGASVRVRDGELRVVLDAPEAHRGRLIGRSGHMVRSLRTLLGYVNVETPHRIALDIAE